MFYTLLPLVSTILIISFIFTDILSLFFNHLQPIANVYKGALLAGIAQLTMSGESNVQVNVTSSGHRSTRGSRNANL